MPPDPRDEAESSQNDFDELVELVGEEIVHLMLEQGQHHHTDDGLPWWLDEERDDALELAKLERDWFLSWKEGS
jgi:hypothetical protein